MAHVLGQTREYLIAHDDELVSPFQRWRLFRLLKKRKAGVPIAYLVGHKEFFGLDFLVNKHTLIPRPETELLVELALEEVKSQVSLVDIGTGSGCIPIAIAKSLSAYERARVQLIATDISQSALRVAKRNARRHDVAIQFLHGNLLEPFLKKFIQTNSKTYNLTPSPSTLVITANLPYLSEQQFDSEPSIQHEPKSALVAADNGLALYEELLKQLSDFSLRTSAFFEIDPSQSEMMKELIKRYLPAASIEIKKDLAGRDRVVMLSVD